MMRAAFTALPICVAAILFVALTGHQILFVALVALPLGAIIRPAAIDIRLTGQRVLAALCGAVAAVALVLLPATGGWAQPALAQWATWLAASALLLAGTRMHVRSPILGLHGTMGLGLIVFLACGTSRSGSIYPLLLAAFAALALIVLIRGDETAAPWSRRTQRFRWGAAGLFVLVATSTLGLAVTLPILSTRVTELVVELFDPSKQVDFGDGPLFLGSLSGLVQSDGVVLRATGEVGPRLRGAVYQQYRAGKWLEIPEDDAPVQTLATAPPASPKAPLVAARIEWADPDRDRFMLPAGVTAARLDPANVRVGASGVPRARPDETPHSVQLIRVPSATNGPMFAPAPPQPEDLEVPTSIETVLLARAKDWTSAARSPAERVSLIAERLEHDYRYSMNYQRSGALDPVVEFIDESREGHCEYFASALALLARASGVPTRLVTGYRVVETNPIGDYWIVRKRHAHAWVEVHLDDVGWVAVDPSPLTSAENAAEATTPFLAGLFDFALSAATPGVRRGLLLCLVALFLVFRARTWFATRSTKVGIAPNSDAPRLPPEDLASLLDHLAADGWSRPPSESLEGFARRLIAPVPHASPTSSPGRPAVSPPEASAPATDCAGAKHLLDRYAALLYGGEGDAGALTDDIESWLVSETHA